MTKIFSLTITSMIFLVLTLSLISAVTVESVDTGKFLPGSSDQVTVTLKNNLQDDVTDVSFSLNLAGTQFTTIGSSEDSIDEIQTDDSENFRFILKTPPEIKPGDYNIPYTITYNDGTAIVKKNGSFGITIGAKTELSYSVTSEKNVLGEKDSLKLNIVNSGLGDVRFVSVKVEGVGMDILSTKEEYIGTVASDDFETANFDVVYKSQNAKLKVTIKYKDLDNKDLTQNIELPIKVYSREEGLSLGIIQKSYAIWYVVVIIIIIIAWIIYRRIKKSRRNGKNGR